MTGTRNNMTNQEAIRELKKKANPKNVAGMARFGINPKNTLGVSIPEVRRIAKDIKKQSPISRHKIAQELWASKIHEARILAGMIDLPELVSEKQADKWAGDFDSWDTCDQVCMNLFDKTKFAFDKAKDWAGKEGEFVKRAGFALMASLAFHDKKANNLDFVQFLPIIKKHSNDERNFVKKAVNWALRQIGKRNKALNQGALQTAKEIKETGSKTAKWIAKDAIRELSNYGPKKNH